MKARPRHIILLLMLTLLSCHEQRSYFPNEIPSVEVEIVRFDSAVLVLSQKDTISNEDIRHLSDEYAQFIETFTQDIIGVRMTDTATFCSSLYQFLNDTLYGFKATNQRVSQTFADITDLREDINLAFSRLSYLYPDLYIPQITLFVSGFNASILFYDGMVDDGNADAYMPILPQDIAVGVDMYLGSDYEYYNRVVYNYQKQTMRKECIPVDVVSAYMFSHFLFSSEKNRLIDNMIYRGKIMYVLSCLFSDTPEYEIMGYSKEQWQWCERNEKAIWQIMMDRHDLFRTESMTITSYLNDGPFTSPISQDSPSRLGTWIGWQIVRSYMQNNAEVSLQELLATDDAQLLLSMSRYNP